MSNPTVFLQELPYQPDTGGLFERVKNLPAPLRVEDDPARPNLEVLRRAVDAGATVHYHGGWSREVALDALLGWVHVVNVCNNLLHQDQFLPRSNDGWV